MSSEDDEVVAAPKAKAPRAKREVKPKKRAASDDDEDVDEEEEEEVKPKKSRAKAPAKVKAGKDKDDGGGKKKRAKKDPNAPKGALSAFMFFSQGMRDKVKADNPGIAFGEIGKVMGEKWKAATPDEKAPYEEKAKKDKERHAREMAAFKAGGSKAAADDDDEDDE